MFLFCVNIGVNNWGTLHGRKLNAEFSLQSASHNSRENNKRQSWSQIREK